MLKRGAALRSLSDLLHARSDGPKDWEGLLTFCNQELITPQVVAHLEAQGRRDVIPERFREFLADLINRTKKRNRSLEQTTNIAVKTLNAVGIKPVLLKGIALAAARQFNISRLISDIDLLVSSSQIDAATRALEASGFNIENDRRDCDAHQSVVLARSHDAGSIDLHQHLPGPATLTHAVDVLPFCTPIQNAAFETLLPSPELQIVILIVHDQLQDGRLGRGGFDFRHLLDIAAIIESNPRIDWDVVANFFRSKAVKSAVLSELYSARQIVAASVPTEIFSGSIAKINHLRQRAQFVWPKLNSFARTVGLNALTQPLDPGRSFGESVRLSFWFGHGH